MKKYKSTWMAATVIAVSVVLFSGCSAQLGNPHLTDVGRYMQLQQSITTKRGVHTHFGQPHDVVYTGDESTWIYYYTKWTMHGATFVPFVGLLAGGGNYDNTVTAFHFDQDGLFQRVASDNSVNYVNMWEGLVRAPVKLLTEQQTDRVRKEMAHLGIPFDPAVARKVKDITSAHRIGQKPPQ